MIHHSPTSGPVLAAWSRAFSLPEVTLAVGVAALGILSLLGMIPQGLNMARGGSNTMSEMRIIQQMVGEAQSTDWGTFLASYTSGAGNAGNRCFDDQAIEIPPGSGDLSRRLAYVAHLEIQVPDVHMPAGTAATGSVGEQDLRKLVIRIASTADPSFNFDATQPRLFKTYTTLVSRTTPDFNFP